MLRDQITYYRQRAAEYDQTSYGDVAAAAERVERIVGELAVSGSVLELACGTGVWTVPLARRASTITAVDSSPEALAIAVERCPGARFQRADVFSWEPGRRYDLVFFAFWLSHVPTEQVPEFFGRLATWLRPGGRVAFVDEPAWRAVGEQAVATGSETVRRALRDGSEHLLVKVPLDPARVIAQLDRVGWVADVHPDGPDGGDWIVGQARPR